VSEKEFIKLTKKRFFGNRLLYVDIANNNEDYEILIEIDHLNNKYRTGDEIWGIYDPEKVKK
jgi:hypothetical protein